MEILFIALGAVGLVVGVYINYYDYCTGSILNRGEVGICQYVLDVVGGKGACGLNCYSYMEVPLILVSSLRRLM